MQGGRLAIDTASHDRAAQRRPRVALLALLGALAVTAFLASPAPAATVTWDGGGGNGNWSTGSNWVGNAAPGNGDDVVLNTDGSNPTNYDLAVGVQLASVNLQNGPVDENLFISGNPIALASGGTITNNRTGANLSNLFSGVALNGPAGGTITASAGSAGLDVNAVGGTGPLTLVHNGTGAFRLGGPGSYSGATIVNGTEFVVVPDADAIPAGTALTVNGKVRFFPSQTIGSLAGGGIVEVSGDTLTVGGDNTNTVFSGVFRDSGSSAALTKEGAGTLVLAGANTHTGPTTMNNGTIRAGAVNALSAGSAHMVSAGATLDLNNFNQTIGSLAGAGNVTLGFATLAAGGNDSSTTYSGTLSGPGGLTKTGTGTLGLSGTNTYSGSTTVSGGALALTGSIASPVTVNPDATLAGTGSTSSGVTVDPGGTLAPGTSVGTLSTGSLVLASGSSHTVEIDATGADRVNVAGSVDLAGASLDLSLLPGYVHDAGTVHTLISNDGADAVNGTYAGLPEGAVVTAGGNEFRLSYVGGSGNDVTLATITPPAPTPTPGGGGEPEPQAGDEDPPQTTITSTPRKPRPKHSYVSFSSSEPNSTFRCSLDGGAFEPCSSPQDFRKLRRGRHTLDVFAIDAAGNADPSPAQAEWRVGRRR